MGLTLMRVLSKKLFPCKKTYECDEINSDCSYLITSNIPS